MHLFWSVNVTSFYFYVLPNVFCATLLLYVMMSGVFDDFFKPEHLVKKSILFLVVYLALFSNLFASIILAAFGGILLIVRLWKAVKEGFNLKQFCSHNAAWLVLIVAWFMVQLLEATGGRAASLDGGLSYGERLQVTINTLTTLPISKVFCVLLLIAIVFYIVAVIRRRNSEQKINLGLPVMLFFAGLLSLAYTVLVVAKVDPTYIVRADVIFPVLFFMIMIAMTCCAIAVKRFPRVTLLLPLLMLLVVFHIYTNGNTFKDINIAGLAPETSYAVTQDIIEQIEEAGASGQTAMELKVPASPASDNWPFALYAGDQDYFARTALKMGLIANDIEITVVPDPAKNAQFGLTAL